MFDWLEFDLTRLTQPVVIVGMIMMIIGLVLVLSSLKISETIQKKYNKNMKIVIYIVSIVILFIGIFITILGAK